MAVLARRGVVDVAIRGRHAGGIGVPIAAADATRRTGCAIQIVPLPDVAGLVKRGVVAPAAAKRPYVSCGADGIIVVRLIGTAADRGAGSGVTLRGISPVAGIRAAALVVRRLVPLVLKRYPVRRS